MANAATATYAGRTLIWARFKGSGSEPLNLGWGTGTVTGSQNSDVNLFAPATETRVAGVSTVLTTAQLGDTYQVTGTLTCLVAAKGITEAGLFDTTTLSGTSTTTTTISTNAQTSVTVGAAFGPATGNFYAQLGNEVVLVTGGQGTTVISFTRGQLGSTAGTSYAVGTPITAGGDGGAHSLYGIGGQTATVNATAGGNMFAHADFAVINLNVNDSIAFVWKDQLT